MVVWLIFVMLILIAVAGLWWSYRYAGWWIGYRTIGDNRKFRECLICDGNGVMWLAPEPGGTTALIAIPKGMRRENKDNAKGDWYSGPDNANVIPCDRCDGAGGMWIHEDDKFILKLRFPWPWRT